MDENARASARELHRTLEFIGLRAQATSVGLLQLCTELVNVGILDEGAVQRIKSAVQQEIAISARPHNRAEFEATLKERLDSIFPKCGGQRATVGTIEDLQEALDPDHQIHGQLG